MAAVGTLGLAAFAFACFGLLAGLEGTTAGDAFDFVFSGGFTGTGAGDTAAFLFEARTVPSIFSGAFF
jgi:hypothetical protein